MRLDESRTMERDVIVQMFNIPFGDVQKRLPKLENRGFSHVLVSPPQKSHPSREWWARYQPVDYTVIEGPLGSASELKALCEEAAQRGLVIVVDAVLNHMCNHSDFLRLEGSQIVEASFPRFSKNDFHTECISRGNIHRQWLGNLPDLRTETSYVRQELRNYLHLLYGLGVRGFRFDAAKHIEVGFFKEVLAGLEGIFCFGELVFSSARDVPGEYLALMRAYDFPLARTLREAFVPDGDLGRLVDPFERGEALWGPMAVTFVNHHDLVKNPEQFADFRISDERDRQLGYAYIFGREDGTPLVFGEDFDSPEVEAGLCFHNLALGQPTRWVQAEPNVLVWRRGDNLLAAINKSGAIWDGSRLKSGLQASGYRDWISGKHFGCDAEGRLADWKIPPRSAMFLVEDTLIQPSPTSVRRHQREKRD